MRSSALVMMVGLVACGGSDWRDQLDVDVIARPDKVIVVGAGMAGLTAAQALRLDGREVIVLEARDRMGGRTWTEEVGGVPVDLGAAWIHGPKDNPAALLLEGYGGSWEEDQSLADVPLVRDADGRSYDAAEQRAAESFAWDALGAFEDVLEDLGKSDVSMGEVIDWHLDDWGLSGAGRTLAAFVGRQYAVELDYAAPADDISAAAEWEVFEHKGGDVVPVGGYAGLVEALAEGVEVRLSEPVTAMDWSGDTVSIETSAGTYTSEQVIITVPLWVLQSEQIVFTPPLPAERLALFEKAAMADLEKVILRYEDRWWADDGATFLFMDEEPGRYPLCADFTEHTGAPTLACFTGGAFSETTRAEASDEEVIAGTVENLGRVLERADLPEPTEAFVTRWSTDPLAGGSYSYVRVGGTLDDLLAMGEPIDNKLLFGGEHTAGTHHQTVHGAVLSGLREAARLGADPYALPGLD